MKLFEIGDGLKSIKVASDYYSDWDEEYAQTVLLYKGEDNEPEVRITVISAVPQENVDINSIYYYIIKEGEEKGHPVTQVAGKSYYLHTEVLKSQNRVIRMYEIGYKCSFVILTVTISLKYKDSPLLKKTLQEVESFIPSIDEISLKGITIFEPKYTDFVGIEERISGILEIEQDDIDNCHEADTTLSKIQQILDEKKYTSEQTYELQSLGLALGDYLQYKDERLHWAVVRDKHGRDLCLQYKNTTLTVFPMTMISKRIEDGEEVVVETLVKGLFNIIEAQAKDNDFKELDHNY